MKLLAHCKISPKGVYINGELKQNLTKTDTDWKKEIYSNSDVDYPKFHKMDPLAKMAFLAYGMIEPKIDMTEFKDDDVVLLFANSSSSHTTDEKYIVSYTEKGSPSPSLFVYTLPNILTGELSILNKWYGENIFFIQENFDAEFYLEQINFYFRRGAKACLCGWVESGLNGEECFLFMVENSGGKITDEELNNYYKQ